ncbi:MAG: tripartite tricarboxylate transporter TctB family protein [Geminicoccaceae bacterium]
MPDQPSRQPGEPRFSLLLLLASLFLAWRAWTIAGFCRSLGGVMPMLATGTMALAGLVILGQTARRRAAAERRPSLSRRGHARRLAIFAAMIVLYMLALEPAGFWSAPSSSSSPAWPSCTAARSP